MLICAIILFIIAAVFGLIILAALLEDRATSKRVVLLHGVFAATAIMLILIYMFLNSFSTTLIASLILFIIAVLGGLTLVTLDMKKRTVPKLLAVLHPVIAIAGLIVLIIYVLP
jgi:hypothetical protein